MIRKGRQADSYLKNKRWAANYLGVSLGTIERMIASGKGPRFIKVGYLVKFRPEDLAAFVEQNARGGQLPAPAVAGHLDEARP